MFIADIMCIFLFTGAKTIFALWPIVFIIYAAYLVHTWYGAQDYDDPDETKYDGEDY